MGKNLAKKRRRHERQFQSAEIINLLDPKFEIERALPPIKALNPTQADYLDALRKVSPGDRSRARGHRQDLDRGHPRRRPLPQPPHRQDHPDAAQRAVRALARLFSRQRWRTSSRPGRRRSPKPSRSASARRPIPSRSRTAASNWCRSRSCAGARGRTPSCCSTRRRTRRRPRSRRSSPASAKTAQWSSTATSASATSTDDSGLRTVIGMIEAQNLPVPVIEFTRADIVRSGICAMWVNAFEEAQI